MFEAASFPEDDAQHCTSNCCDYKIASAELDDPGVGVLAGEMVT
jgi:peroxiredoxin